LHADGGRAGGRRLEAGAAHAQADGDLDLIHALADRVLEGQRMQLRCCLSFQVLCFYIPTMYTLCNLKKNVYLCTYV
jgi:hypothetical protein